MHDEKSEASAMKSGRGPVEGGERHGADGDMDGAGQHRQVAPGAGEDPGPGGQRRRTAAAGAGARNLPGGAGPVPGLRGHRLPPRGGAELPAVGQPGAGADRRRGGRDTGRRGQAANDAAGPPGGPALSDGLRPPLPEGALPGGAGGAVRRAPGLPGGAGAAGGGLERPGWAHRGEGPGLEPDLRRLSPPPEGGGPGPPGPDDPAGGGAGGLRVRRGQGRLP